jgi:hypothetical protein
MDYSILEASSTGDEFVFCDVPHDDADLEVNRTRRGREPSTPSR